MNQVQQTIDAVREAFAPDPRMCIFDVEAEADGSALRLTGEVTDPPSMDELLRQLARIPGIASIDDQVVRLAGRGSTALAHGVVRGAVAPVYAVPDVAAPMVSQLVIGHRVELLSQAGVWWRVRAEDGYIGWVHRGYLLEADHDWARAWELGTRGEPVVSLGADLVDEEERIVGRVPWGGRLLSEARGLYQLPDGRKGNLASGEFVAVDRLRDRFPPRGESVTRTARRWLGSPYLWGGVTPSGTDCSGFVQSVFWMHGIALPRDSDMQARTGAPVEANGDWTVYKPGDLLFFAERPGAISHVGMGLGGGLMIHSSLSNGGVQINDLTADAPAEVALREIFVCAVRLLPD